MNEHTELRKYICLAPGSLKWVEPKTASLISVEKTALKSNKNDIKKYYVQIRMSSDININQYYLYYDVLKPFLCAGKKIELQWLDCKIAIFLFIEKIFQAK